MEAAYWTFTSVYFRRHIFYRHGGPRAKKGQYVVFVFILVTSGSPPALHAVLSNFKSVKVSLKEELQSYRACYHIGACKNFILLCQ